MVDYAGSMSLADTAPPRTFALQAAPRRARGALGTPAGSVVLAASIIAAALAAAWYIVNPPSGDLSAHIYRAQLFAHYGFTLWDGQWYAGHDTPAYSVLFPPTAAWLGPRLVGALSAPLAAAAFALIAIRGFGPRARLGALWFAAATVTSLLSGRVPFAAGTALGLAALAAASQGAARTAPPAEAGPLSATPRSRARRVTPASAAAVALALACTLMSPVAGLFLAIAAGAWWLAQRRMLGLALALAALVPIALLSLLFPEGGFEPYAFSVFWHAVAAAVVLGAVALVAAHGRTLLTASVIYALVAIAAYLIHTPVGSNTTRLAALVAGPVLACALLPRNHRVALGVLAIPALWFQWADGIRDVRTTWGDPSVQASYYQPLLHFLDGQGGAPFRIEIPFTAHHYEAAYVAPQYPLARGWERQLDIRYNGLFNRAGQVLTAAQYSAWLDSEGVRFIALSDARLDYSAFAEAYLLRNGRVPGLREVFHSAHWIVWERAGARLVVGDGRLTQLGVESFTLDAGAAGALLVREHFTPYWAIAQGSGCVAAAPGPGGWTLISARRPGRIHVVIRFSLGRVLDHGPRCSG